MTYYIAEIRFNRRGENRKREKKMKKRLIKHLIILLLASLLVSTPFIIISAAGSDKSDAIESLEDLCEDILELPEGAEGFKNPRAAEGHRRALCNKIRAVIHQVKAGAYKGAINKLRNDIENAIRRWVDDQWVDDLIEKVENIIDLIIGLISPVHDIAITSVTVSPTEVYVGDPVYVNVTVANEGTEPETFDVYVYADTEITVIGDEITVGTMFNVTLDPGANTTLNFVWDTAGVAEGTYTISAYVPPVEGEEDDDICDDEDDTGNNLFIDGTVTVTLPPLLRHDVTVTGVTAPAEVTQGVDVTISVDVANPGDFLETFNVLVTYDTTLIDSESVTLEPKDNITLLFVWDTDDVTPGTYTITAEAVLDTDENLTNNEASTSITIVPGPAPPVASFTFSPTEPVVGETVTFDASGSYDPDGDIVSYLWNFGDGDITTVTTPIITHVYAEVGTYTVTLTVTDNDNLTASASADVTVSPIPPTPEPPVASFTYEPIDPLLNQNVTFDASASTPNGGSIVSYVWDFGDGTTDIGVTVTHAYTAYGNYTVTLNVTDSQGLWDITTDTVRVYPRPPTAHFTFLPLTPYTDETVTFDAAGSSDPDGDVVWYYWNFGDGTAQVNATDPIVHHMYTDDGTYTVTLVVGDNDGLTDTVYASITVLNRGPVAIFTESAESVYTDETIIFNASESYDPDGEIVSYVWDFGDGTTGTGVTVNHTYTEAGNYTVTLTVTDDDGASSSVSAEKTVEAVIEAGWPLALLAAIGLGIAALTATLLYALYRRRRKREAASASGSEGFGGSPPLVTLYVPAKILAGCD
jgi:PKD repeat protein